jgi:hypothetical protein
MDETTIMVHVRFSPDGMVVEIGERPHWAEAQEWFNVLSNRMADTYESLSGGRGVFRAARAELDSLKAASAQ